MNSFLLFIGSLIVLALSALFIAPYFVDWNDYRDVFEAQATKLIGRKVDVGGDVSLSLLPAPVVRFETINVADSQGGFETPFAAARSFTVWLSVPPLLRGTIEARSVEVDQPVVNLRVAKDGSGNWSDLGGEAASLPFIPNEVALNSLKVSGATINFWRGGNEPSGAIDNLNGELTARSLQGPYKFIGEYSQGDNLREVRFSTGRREEEGDFRLSATIRNPEVRETYSIDGSVRGFGAIPVFKGKFRARLADDAPMAEDGDEKKQDAAPFEIKSELLAGFIAAQFSETELTVTRNNKPQTVRGLLDVNYQNELVVGGTFSSRWVDLDSWVTPGKDASQGFNTSVAALAGEVLRRGTGIEKGAFKLFLDQAVIAGDLATNVQIELSAEKGKIEVSRLSARLPGNARFRLSGNLSGTSDAPFFKGPFSVQGRSLSRLLRWTGVQSAPDAAKQSGTFTLAATLSAGPQLIALEGGEGSLLGSAFNGAFSYRGGDPNVMSLTLKSDRMDLAKVLGSGASVKSIWGLFASTPGPEGGTSAKSAAGFAWLGNTRAEADVNIGQVSFAGLGESSLDAKVTLSDGTLDIRKLDLSADPEVRIQAGGRLSELGGKPKGSLTLAMHARSGEGLAAVAEFFELPLLATRSPEQLAALSPLELKTAVRSTQSDNPGLEVQIEGVLGGSNISAKLDLQGSPAEWRSNQIAVNGNLTNKSGRDLLQQLQPRLQQTELSMFGEGGGTISLEASGVPETGLQTRTVLKAGGTDWVMQGSYQMADSGASFSGSTQLTATNTAAGLSLFGIRVAPGHSTQAASMSADVESNAGTYRIANLKGDFGGAQFSGGGTIETAGERPMIVGQIAANAASLPYLFAPLVAWKPEGSVQHGVRGVSGTATYWPDAPFSGSQLTRADGEISLMADRLRLAGGLVIDKASVKAKLSGGVLSVPQLEGTLYGGSFKANGRLEARGEGVALDAQATANAVRLEQVAIGSEGNPLVNAPANISVSVKGVGLTPAGLASGLSGKGEIEIGDGKINGFSLGAAHAAAVSAQREKGKLDETKLGRRVAESMKSSNMSFNEIKAPFSIRNGIVEFDKIALSDADGRVTVASYLQLANLQLDSEWALQSADSATSGAKPRVSLVFVGPLEDVGKLQPKIDTANLARYVTIRKMERDVERLEKLDVSPSGSSATAPVGPKPTPPAPKNKNAAKKPVEPVIPVIPKIPSPATQPRPAAAPPPSQQSPSAQPPVSAAVPSAPVQPAPAPQRKPPATQPAPPPATTVQPVPVVPAPNTAARTPQAAPRPYPYPQVAPRPQPYPGGVPQPPPNAGAIQPPGNLPWQPPGSPYGAPGTAQVPGQLPPPDVPPDAQVLQQPPLDSPPPAGRRGSNFNPFAQDGN